MISQIAPKYYYDDEIFKIEQKAIFKKVWNFAGFIQDLQKDNDFVTLTIDGYPIVVQKLKGVIKAFTNICPHRFSLIQLEKKGNRKLFCPYHGWSFNSEGIPSGIPKRPMFKDYSQDELCKMRLNEFRVEVCGALVFVNINKDAISLKEYLGSYYDELEGLTNNFGERVDTNPITVKSNWKVLVENTMESYHNVTVHTNTIAQLIPTTTTENVVFNFNSPHSYFIIPLLLKEDSKKLQAAYKPFRNRSWKLDGYIHYLVFPNLLVSTSYGVINNVSTIKPIDANTTQFESNVFLSKLDDGYTEKDVEILTGIVIDFNRRVFEEDNTICEAVQVGVKHTDQPGVLSLEEYRLEQFQKDYIRFIQQHIQ